MLNPSYLALLFSRSRFAHDKRRAGLLGQLARLLGSAHQRLRDFLQVGVFRVGNGCFHDGQLSASKTGGAPELSYSCQLSTSRNRGVPNYLCGKTTEMLTILLTSTKWSIRLPFPARNPASACFGTSRRWGSTNRNRPTPIRRARCETQRSVMVRDKREYRGDAQATGKV